MSTNASGNDGDGLHAAAELLARLALGFEARFKGLNRAGEDWTALMATLERDGGVATLLLAMAVVAAVTAGAAMAVDRLVRGRAAGRRWLSIPAGAAAGVICGAGSALLLSAGAPDRRTALLGVALAILIAVIAVPAFAALVRRAGLPARATGRLARLRRMWLTALIWALGGMASGVILRAYGAGTGLRDLVGSGLFAVPAIGLFIFGAIAHRRAIAAVVAGRRPRSTWRGRVSRLWPGLLAAGFAALFVSAQVALALGGRIAPLALIVTALALILVPFGDPLLRAWAATGAREGRVAAGRLALRRTARPAAFAAMAGLLVAVWSAPILAATGAAGDQALGLALKIAVVGLGASFLWNLVAVATGRALSRADDLQIADDGQTDEGEDGAPRTRLETLAPLLSAVVRWSVVGLSVLSVLVILGVNVWPIITGLSVFGIAIGFGSQTLVKDVVSGLFFLIDDAFRKGEYIETSGAKGVVEKISVRSISLRHQRGALATIPYGAIGKIQNYSRDWVIEKLLFRVSLDTDVEKVRKIFKRIGIALAADPELAGDLIEPFKSQGVAEIEEGTLVIGGKFKAKAGRQSLIRRKVLAEVQRAFLENGVQAVARPVAGGR